MQLWPFASRSRMELELHSTPGSKQSSKLHKMYQYRCTAKNSWWWTEKLPETCRVIIPINLEFSASVGFIHKENRTSYKIWRWNFLNWDPVRYSVKVWFHNLQGKLSVSSRADSSGPCACPAGGIFLWRFSKSTHWIWSQRGWIWEVCWHFWLWHTLTAWGWWVTMYMCCTKTWTVYSMLFTL